MSLLDDTNADALLEQLDLRSVVMLYFVNTDNRRLIISRVRDIISYSVSRLHTLDTGGALEICTTLDIDPSEYLLLMQPWKVCGMASEMITRNRPTMLRAIIHHLFTNKIEKRTSIQEIMKIQGCEWWDKERIDAYFDTIRGIVEDIIVLGKFHLLRVVRDVEEDEHRIRVLRIFVRVAVRRHNRDALVFLLNNQMLVIKDDLLLCLATLNDNDLFDEYKNDLRQSCNCNDWGCWKWIEEPLRIAGRNNNNHIRDGIVAQISGVASGYIMGKIRRLID